MTAQKRFRSQNMMSKINLELIAFTVALNLAGCASIRVGQQVQSGRSALQT